MCYIKETFEASNHVSFWKTLHRTCIKTNKKSKTLTDKSIVNVMFTFYRLLWLTNVITDS